MVLRLHSLQENQEHDGAGCPIDPYELLQLLSEEATQVSSTVEKRTPLERIQDLSQRIQTLAEQRREKISAILRMPVTPTTILSSSATVAACGNIIPGSAALTVSLGSLSYAAYKIYHLYLELSDNAAERREVIARILLLLPQTQERDILPLRTILSDIPELEHQTFS